MKMKLFSFYPNYLRSNSERGVTFVELLLVIAIISVVGVLSSSFYGRFLNQNSVDVVSDQLAGQLRKAQVYSMMGKQSGSVWGVNYSSNTITLFKGDSYATRDNTFDEKYTVHSSITITGFSEVTFARGTGQPSANATVTIASLNNSTGLQLNSMGVVSRQ